MSSSRGNGEESQSSAGDRGGDGSSGSAALDAQSGPIGSPPLVQLLRRVSQMGFSGVLYLRRGDERRRLYLSNGALVLATSTVPGERLGDYLLARGLCSPELLREATERSKSSGRGLLEVLEEAGGISTADHQEVLCRLTEQVLYNAGDWNAGQWELARGKLPPETARPSVADQPVWAAMLNQYEDWRKVFQILADVKTCLVLAPDALKQPAYRELGFAPKQLLSHFSRERAVQQIARGRVMNRFDELLTLARCVEVGLLHVTQMTRPDEVRASDVVEAESTLPLNRSAAAAAASELVRQQIAEASKAVAAKRTATPARGASDIEEVRRRRQRASELRDLAAEQNRVGGDIQKGVELLQQAIQLDPDSIELHLMGATMLMRNPRRMDDAEGFCRKALAIDPENGRAHLLRGKISIALRNVELARTELELAAAHGEGAEAERLLATLSRTSPAAPVASSNRVPMPLSAVRGTRGLQSPPPPPSFFQRRPVLSAVLLLALLGGWGFGTYRMVLWRLDEVLGPRPERTVLSSSEAQ